MASKTYRCRGIVLRKSRFGESDQVITLLLEDGSQLRLVAKGSRKPTNRSSSYLELFNTADILCAKGRGLDVATETSLVRDRHALGSDPVLSTVASSIAEALVKTTDVELVHPRLFDMTEAALDCLEGCDEQRAALLLSAFILKMFAMEGFRPVLSECVICGTPVSDDVFGNICVSASDGGAVCGECSVSVETASVKGEAMRASDMLLRSRFDEVVCMDVPDAIQFEMLHFCQMWTNVHIGAKLKSLALFCDLHFIRNQ